MAPKLSEEQLASYRDAFALIDRDSSGTISKEELTQLLQSLQGRKPTEAEIKYIMDKIDIDRSGTIEFDEFLSLMSRPELSPTLSNRSTPKIAGFNGITAEAVLDDEEDELIQAFKVFDKDGSGKISAPELDSVMKKIGENLTKEELNQMIMEADLNGDREIDFLEFKKMVSGR